MILSFFQRKWYWVLVVLWMAPKYWLKCLINKQACFGKLWEGCLLAYGLWTGFCKFEYINIEELAHFYLEQKRFHFKQPCLLTSGRHLPPVVLRPYALRSIAEKTFQLPALWSCGSYYASLAVSLAGSEKSPELPEKWNQLYGGLCRV